MKTTHLTQEATFFNSVKGISNEKELRTFIPHYPKILDKRIQTTLDYFSLEFIQVATIAFLAMNSSDDVLTPLHINSDIKIQSNTQLRLNSSLSEHTQQNSTSNASLYFMASGLGHGLRINGFIRKHEQQLTFQIEAVYFHCARAAARADIWNASKSQTITEENILHYSPFALLKTMNIEGKTELSPRGDSAGFVKALSKNTLVLPERPGNKIAVSLRNILTCSCIELLFLVPNSNQMLNIKGTAKVIVDQTLLEKFAMNGKKPKTGILIKIEESQFKYSVTLEKSGMWETKNNVEKSSITSFSKALSSHINGTGLLGKTTNLIVDAVVKHDMKHLY